jgi:hypothetical protein
MCDAVLEELGQAEPAQQASDDREKRGLAQAEEAVIAHLDETFG